MNSRGLSEGNTDGLISNREFSSEPVHKDIEASPKRKRTAERHQKEIFIHDNLSDKKFQCMKCNKIYTHIYRHNKSIHEGVKYPCTECSYKTSYKSNLQQHVAALHEGVRYLCTECNYKATTKKIFNNIWRHTVGATRQWGAHPPYATANMLYYIIRSLL